MITFETFCHSLNPNISSSPVIIPPTNEFEICCINRLSLCLRRRIFLPKGGPGFPEEVLLLPLDNLHSLRYAGGSIMGIILVGCERYTGSSISRSHHSTNHGYADYWYQQLSTARLLH